MALTIKENIKVAIMEEGTEGEYEAPAAGGDFVGVLADGLEVAPSKELLERSVITGSIGKVTPRTGTKSVTASLGMELKAGATTGAAPEIAPMLKAALGATRNRATDVTTKASGNTATVLGIEDADIADLQIGDIVLVKQAGAYHVSPISARSTGAGTATITLLIAHPSGDMTDSVHIAPFRTYYTANSGHPTISVSKYVEDAVLETAVGCRVSSMALQGYATGQLPSFGFSLEGLSFARTLEAPGFTPSLDSSLPPVVLNATVYVDGVAVDVNEVAFSVENTLGFATSTGSSNGRISSRIASRVLTGTLNPYKQDDSLANFNRFNNGTQFSLFSYAYNPSGVAGEFNQVVAFYMPKCIVTELGEGDADGLLQDTISFSANRGSDGATEELYVSSI